MELKISTLELENKANKLHKLIIDDDFLGNPNNNILKSFHKNLNLPQYHYRLDSELGAKENTTFASALEMENKNGYMIPQIVLSNQLNRYEKDFMFLREFAYLYLVLDWWPGKELKLKEKPLLPNVIHATPINWSLMYGNGDNQLENILDKFAAALIFPKNRATPTPVNRAVDYSRVAFKFDTATIIIKQRYQELQNQDPYTFKESKTITDAIHHWFQNLKNS